jgi:hypothetical protein
MVKYCFFLFSLIFVYSAFALPPDFGGSLQNGTTVVCQSPVPELRQMDTLSGWLSQTFGSCTLTLQASGTFSYNDGEVSFVPSVDVLSFSGHFPISLFDFHLLEFMVGRTYFGDSSGYVLSSNLDGGSVGLHASEYKVELALAYSGLQSGTLKLSLADNATTDSYFSLPGRLMGLAQVEFYNLLEHHFLGSVIVQQDLNEWAPGTDMVSAGDGQFLRGVGGVVNTQYLNLEVRGQLGGLLFYEVFASLGTGSSLLYHDLVYKDVPLLSFLGSLEVVLSQKQWLNSLWIMRLLYSSGDSWDNRSAYFEASEALVEPDFTHQFIPLTRSRLALLFSPRLGNIWYSSVAYSFKPLAKLQGEIVASTFFRSQQGPVAITNTRNGSNASYLGSEVDVSANFSLLPDVGLAVSGGLFFPANGTGGLFEEERDSMEWLFTVYGSLSF